MHYAIYEGFGCKDIKFGINHFQVYTICMEEGYQKTETHKLAHAINEVIGYTFFLILIISITIFLYGKEIVR